MKASKVIEALQSRIDLYGDIEVGYWDDEGGEAILPVNDVFAEPKIGGKIVLTNCEAYKLFGFDQG